MAAAVNRASPFPPLSVLLPSVGEELCADLRRVAALGFRHVDLAGLTDRPSEHLAALADSGLLVGCVSIGRGLPEGHTLDAASLEQRRATVEAMKQHIADAARIGATSCYLVPGKDMSAAGMVRFGEACELLADYAERRMIPLCVEPAPATALARADKALAWIRAVGHSNLRLLLDVGHCLISGEDPAHAILQAGSDLGYVHLDDNDGQTDLHWPLLQGRLTEAVLRDVLSACRSARCIGLALELRGDPDLPEVALRRGKDLIDRLDRHLA